MKLKFNKQALQTKTVESVDDCFMRQPDEEELLEKLTTRDG